MRGTLVSALALGLSLLAVAPASAAPFRMSLDGSQEVPPNDSPGVGSGTGVLSGGPGAYVFTYEGSFGGLTTPLVAGHFHNAPPGVNGPIVHFLDNLPLGALSGAFSGAWAYDDAVRPLTDALATALLNGDLYINLHTQAFPGGEIRGQVVIAEPMTALLLAPAFALLGLAAGRGRGPAARREAKARAGS